MSVKSKNQLFGLIWPLFAFAGSAAIVIGILAQNKGFPLYWSTELMHDTVAWGVGCGVAGLIVRWLAPARSRTVVLGLAAAYLAVGVGPSQVAAAILFFLSCICCGRLALEIAFPDEPVDGGVTKAFLVGLALQLALFSILIHFPVNSGLRYLVLLALPIVAYLAMRRPPVGATLARWAGAGDVFPDLPFWLLVLAIAACGVGLRFAFLPGVDHDSNAIHLRLWTELTFRHRFNFDVLSQVWNVGPYLVDLMKAVVSLAAGRDARSAVGLGLLVLLIRQMWVVADRFGLKAADRLLLVVALISTPMTGWLVLAMPAELMFALLATAGIRLALGARSQTGRSDATAILAVAALCCGTKMNGAVLGLCLLLVAAPRLWVLRDQSARLFDPRRLWPLAGFVLAFAITALGAYLTAWRVARNPFFPMYNGIFKSPYFNPVNFADMRWVTGFGPKQFVDIFFKTSRFGENYDFVAGFQYLFLMPVGLVILGWRYRKDMVAWAIFVPVLLFGLVMFLQIQYMRYAFPVLPAATLAIGALLSAARTAADGWSIRAAVAFCVALNLFFYPGISWILPSAAPQASFTEAGKEAQIKTYAPAQAVAEDIASRNSDPRVLFPEKTPFGAALKGEPIYVNWYAPSHADRYLAIHSEADVGALMQAYGVTHAIWDTHPAVKPGEPAAFLGAWLHRHAVPESEVGGFVGFALTGVDPAYHGLFDLNAALAARSAALDLPATGTSRSVDGGLALTRDNAVPLAKVDLNYARILRYRVTFRCADAAGTFMADINFDRGAAFHRAVPCDAGPVDFEDVFPLPLGAELGQIYATFHDAGGEVSGLTLETN